MGLRIKKSEITKLQKDAKDLATRATAAETKVADLEKEKAKWIGQAPIHGNRSNSDESQALSYYGVGHVKDLLGVNLGHPRFAHVPNHIKGAVKILKEDVDVARWIAQAFYGSPQDHVGRNEKEDRVAKVKSLMKSRFAKEVLLPKLKAFGSTVVGAGDEWVPTLISSQYVEEYELAHIVEGRLQSFPMPSNPWTLPVETDVTMARIATEGGTMIGSNFGTTSIGFNAVKLSEFHVLPEELDEDSAVTFMPIARANVTKAQIRAYEYAMCNGDDDGTHIDSDVQAAAADHAGKAWKGWRRQAIANSANGGTVDFGGAAVTDANLRKMREKMKKFGVHESELMWVPSSMGYLQMLGTDNVVTVEKFGPNATILQGALSAYGGIPIVTSQFMRMDLNATGVYDGSTTTRTGILLVNHRRWYRAIRRPIRVKIQQDMPQYDRWQLASYSRTDFKGHAQSANETSAVYGFNILNS